MTVAALRDPKHIIGFPSIRTDHDVLPGRRYREGIASLFSQVFKKWKKHVHNSVLEQDWTSIGVMAAVDFLDIVTECELSRLTASGDSCLHPPTP
ncbi:hypothetical protein INR49_006518 [Caranx melampygus]|nr:hypothetical protein INR49_006518 [Caranx melampygus]